MTLEDWFGALEREGLEVLPYLADWVADHQPESEAFWRAVLQWGWYPEHWRRQTWDWNHPHKHQPGILVPSSVIPEELLQAILEKHSNFPGHENHKHYAEFRSLGEAYLALEIGWRKWQEGKEQSSGADWSQGTGLTL